MQLSKLINYQTIEKSNIMSTIALSQKLTYYYNSADRKLYVKSYVNIQTGPQDKCFKKTKTDMNKEADIGFFFVRVNYDTQTLFHDAVLMLLKTNVEINGTDVAKELRKIIVDDLKQKGINYYKVNAGSVNTSTSENNTNTATISSNATIELDKAGEIIIIEIEQNA
jgi:hypothetical protein